MGRSGVPHLAPSSHEPPAPAALPAVAGHARRSSRRSERPRVCPARPPRPAASHLRSTRAAAKARGLSRGDLLVLRHVPLEAADPSLTKSHATRSPSAALQTYGEAAEEEVVAAPSCCAAPSTHSVHQPWHHGHHAHGAPCHPAYLMQWPWQGPPQLPRWSLPRWTRRSDSARTARRGAAPLQGHHHQQRGPAVVGRPPAVQLQKHLPNAPASLSASRQAQPEWGAGWGCLLPPYALTRATQPVHARWNAGQVHGLPGCPGTSPAASESPQRRPGAPAPPCARRRYRHAVHQTLEMHEGHALKPPLHRHVAHWHLRCCAVPLHRRGRGRHARHGRWAQHA